MSVQAALDAAARGWHVFPCQGKQPRARWRWAEWNTTDRARAAEWFADGTSSVGIACGPSGLVVIDLDVADGKTLPPPWDTVPGAVDGVDVFAVMLEAHGESWPDTYTVRTPRGGWHFYYQAGNHGIRNSASQLGPLVDVRGDGGFVVAAGSVRSDGSYELVNDTDPVPLPAWLAAMAAKTTEPRPPARPLLQVVRGGAYVRKALEAEAQAVAAAPSGQRNEQLNKSAFAVARFVVTGELSASDVTEALTAAAGQAGLPASEARRTIQSALKGRRA